MQMNEISIIIPAYKSHKQLDKLLATVFDSLAPEQAEVIIVDQGNKDDIKQMVAQYATQGFIRHIMTAVSDPLSLCKLGAARAQKKYLFFLPAHIDYPADFFPRVQQQEPAPGQGISFSIEKNAASASQIRAEQKSIREIFSYITPSNKTQQFAGFDLGANGTCLLCRRDDFRGLKNLDSDILIDKPLAVNTQKTSTTEPKKSVQPSKKTDNKDQDYKKAEKTVKSLRYKLLNLGFIERAYQDLEELAKGKNPHKRRLAARELALWHANKYTKEDSQKCLKLLETAKQGETDPVRIRQNAVLEAECLHALDQTKKARKVIESELKKENHADLYLVRANLEQEISAKLTWINKALSLHGLAEITCEPEGKSTPYDGLQAKPGAIKKIALPADAPKVTVIIPAYNAQDTISVALDSVLAQTWTNLEVLVVDDCSTDGTVEVVEGYTKKDHRVRLIKAEINQGPYVARNLALREATGDFVTVNDADDWSHPEKIEIQTHHLIENSSIIANISQQTRAMQRLEFYRRGNPGYYIFNNMSSLMFRRKPVMDAMGFWDSVRFTADGEFIQRMKKIFTDSSVFDLSTGPLSFQRQTDNSLTAHEAFGFHGFFMGARKEYYDSYKYFHQISDTLRYEFPQQSRPFSVPEPMLPNYRNYDAGERRHFDVIIASDFRFSGGSTLSNLEEIKAHKKKCIKTGILQINRYDFHPMKKILPAVRDEVDGSLVEFLVYGQLLSCDLLILRYPPVLQYYQYFIPKIQARNINVIVNQPPMSDYSNNKILRYSIKQCAENIRHYFDKDATWYPIGPLVREVLVKYHSEELSYVNLSEQDWHNIIDINDWPKKPYNKQPKQRIIVGRHSRDHFVKWPSTRKDILSVYPESDEIEVHILGGASAPANIIGYTPKNWKVYSFGELHPRDFLANIDVFVYFTHHDWVESFGRVIIEAMVMGVPVILPPEYNALFKDAAIYTTHDTAIHESKQLCKNLSKYKSQVETSLKFVQKNFSYEAHYNRLQNFGILSSNNHKKKVDQNQQIKESFNHVINRNNKAMSLIESSQELLCNICGANEFQSYKNRGKIQCKNCKAIERHRAYKLYFDKFINFDINTKILHFAPENKAIFHWFAQRLGARYHAFDFNEKKYENYCYKGNKVNKFDLCDTKYKLQEKYYDYIIHNHVIEHLPCDFNEVLIKLHSSLTENGYHMFSVPITKDYYDEYLGEMEPKIRAKRFIQHDHFRIFGKKDLHLTIGNIFHITDQLNTSLNILFNISDLKKFNIPQTRWNSFNGACMFVFSKSDMKKL